MKIQGPHKDKIEIHFSGYIDWGIGTTIYFTNEWLWASLDLVKLVFVALNEPTLVEISELAKVDRSLCSHVLSSWPPRSPVVCYYGRAYVACTRRGVRPFSLAVAANALSRTVLCLWVWRPKFQSLYCVRLGVNLVFVLWLPSLPARISKILEQRKKDWVGIKWFKWKVIRAVIAQKIKSRGLLKVGHEEFLKIVLK